MDGQRGFSLVEALIALVVLSLGLVGAAAMQLKALDSADEGYRRALASVAALDAQERLWATYRHTRQCAEIEVGRVESAWRRHWFQHPEAALAEAAWGSIQRDACDFQITIVHAAPGSAPLAFRFELPVKP